MVVGRVAERLRPAIFVFISLTECSMQPAKAFEQVLAKKLSVAEFEAWVYTSPDLEAFLGPDEYLELISLNYKDKQVWHELKELISHRVDWALVRSEELQALLQRIIEKRSADDVLEALMTSYSLYCHNYTFLQTIAMNFGLAADADFDWDEEAQWQRISNDQKWRYLNQFYPMVQEEAGRVLDWLTTSRIQLRLQPDGEIGYIDHRSPAELQAPLGFFAPDAWYVPKLPIPVAAPLAAAPAPSPLPQARKWW